MHFLTEEECKCFLERITSVDILSKAEIIRMIAYSFFAKESGKGFKAIFGMTGNITVSIGFARATVSDSISGIVLYDKGLYLQVLFIYQKVRKKILRKDITSKNDAFKPPILSVSMVGFSRWIAWITSWLILMSLIRIDRI